MTIPTSARATLWLLASLVFALVLVPAAKAAAEENKDEIVQKALQKRTDGFCKAVLPAWFRSGTGVQDPKVRGLVADCYMGHARLAVLGVKTKVSLAETSLSEVPAALLKAKTGINLDIYRPLAGRTVRINAKGQ